MTPSTDTKNINKLVKYILQNNGIDDLKLEIDLTSAWLRYVQAKDKGQTPAQSRLKVTDDIIGKMVELETAGAAREEFRRRVEIALLKSPNWDSVKDEWYGFDRWLMKKDEQGQTIDDFMKWWRSDEFRSKSGVWLTPTKIKENWPAAFERKAETTRPEYQTWTDSREGLEFVKNPKVKR